MRGKGKEQQRRKRLPLAKDERRVETLNSKNRVGYVLADRYEIISEVYRGGISVVLVAKDRKLDTLRIVKEFLKRDDADEELELRRNLASEVEWQRRHLDHPSIARLIDVVEADDSLFAIESYIDGVTLRDAALDRGGCRVPFPVEKVVSWGIELCDVLDYLHTPNPSTGKGVVLHGGLRPENIALDGDGSLRMIGLCRVDRPCGDSEDCISMVGWSYRSKAYSAPEQFIEGARLDARIDVYALGIILHELVTGEPASKHVFHPQPIRYYNDQLPEGLERIIQKCTIYNPEDRYNNCRELKADLERCDELTNALSAKKRTVGGRLRSLLAGKALFR